MGKYDEAWSRIIAGTSAEEALAGPGYLQLTADTLKEFGRQEPRLLVKWDTLADRPKPIARLEASILPLRNGLYLLFKDPGARAYFHFEGKTPPARPFPSQRDLSVFDSYPGAALSESQALDFAFLAGVFQDFTGDPDLRLTLRGRLFSGRFSLALPHFPSPIDVDRVQVEIDAGFEGRDCLLLVEAKRGSREHVLIRQLWYPYLIWRARTRKRIHPVFFTYRNGQVLLTELGFTERFGEVTQLRQRAYALDPSPPPRMELEAMLARGEAENRIPDPRVPFPQANDLDKLTELLLLLYRSPLDKEAIALHFGMETRQADYYANAGIYLGWVVKQGHDFVLTPDGMGIAALAGRSQRCVAVIAGLLRFALPRLAFQAWQRSGLRAEAIDMHALAVAVAKGTGLSEVTSRRRAECLLSWVEWTASNARVTV